MRLTTHGGGCCGIRHLYGMGLSPEGQHSQCWYNDVTLRQPGDSLTGRQAIHRIMEEFIESHPDEGRIIEVTLTDIQDRGWAGELTNRGFVKAARFLNHNTRNFVNIWYYYRSAEHNLELFGGQANREQQVLAPAPVQQPRGNFTYLNGVDYAVEHIHDDGSITALNLESRRATAFEVVLSNDLQGIRQRAEQADTLIRQVAEGTQRVRNLERQLAVREERRHILSTWHCEYRGGRRGAGYDSREAAQRANPRARRIVERRIYSDGTTDFNIGE